MHIYLEFTMEKEERIKKLQKEVHSLRELLSRVEKRTPPGKEEKNGPQKEERIDLHKRIRERKIIDDDIPPF